MLPTSRVCLQTCQGTGCGYQVSTSRIFFPITIGFKRPSIVAGRRLSLLAAPTGGKKRAEEIGFRARDSRPLQCPATSSKCDAMHGVRPDAAARPRAIIKGWASSSAMHNNVDVSTSSSGPSWRPLPAGIPVASPCFSSPPPFLERRREKAAQTRATGIRSSDPRPFCARVGLRDQRCNLVSQ